MKKLYWLFMNWLVNITFVQNDKTYFRINNGLQNRLHFGFQLDKQVLNSRFIWRWSVDLERFTYGKRINNQAYFVQVR